MKTYTQEQLNEILRNHKHWLMQDCDGWEDMRADLSEADLSEAKNVPYIPMACPDSGEFTEAMLWSSENDYCSYGQRKDQFADVRKKEGIPDAAKEEA